VKRFISEPQPPLSGIEIPMEGKAKERREVGEGDDTVVVEDTSDDAMKTKRRCRTASSCGRGLAARACLMFPWYKTPRLAWRLAWLRRHGSRATPPGSV
jgi:hypothetical protein